MRQADVNALVEAGFHTRVLGQAAYFYLPIDDNVELCIEPTTEPGLFELAVYRYENLIQAKKLHIRIEGACPPAHPQR